MSFTVIFRKLCDISQLGMSNGVSDVIVKKSKKDSSLKRITVSVKMIGKSSLSMRIEE